MLGLDNRVRERLLGFVLLASMLFIFGCGGGTGATGNPPPPPPPPPPTHSVGLTWVASASANLQGYQVYRALISGTKGTNLSGLLSPNTFQFTDNTVAAGTTYFYVVTSVDAAGVESLPSAEVSASVPKP